MSSFPYDEQICSYLMRPQGHRVRLSPGSVKTDSELEVDGYYEPTFEWFARNVTDEEVQMLELQVCCEYCDVTPGCWGLVACTHTTR